MNSTNEEGGSDDRPRIQPSEVGARYGPWIGEERRLPSDFIRQTIHIQSLESLALYIQGSGVNHRDHFRQARGLFYLVIIAVTIAALAFILAGLGLVYLGATGHSELDAFGFRITSTNVGIISIALGALVLVRVLSRVMDRIQDILKLFRTDSN
ncbi:MAG: hypothetical protein QOF14_3720 [Hyphomicrobiales bacterium]|jgi:hypothetical protein|nr:hypothetical protein [Hyphomicrobiales bacterium]